MALAIDGNDDEFLIMRYEYICNKCQFIFEIDKGMNDPAPVKCRKCKKKGIERYFSPAGLPMIMMGDRPPWTYKEAKKFKTAKYKGKEFKIDPAKHGDLASWNSPGEVIPPKPKKKKKC